MGDGSGHPDTIGDKRSGSEQRAGGDEQTGDKRTGLGLRRTIARLLLRGADGTTRWVARLLGESLSVGRSPRSGAELRELVAQSTVLDRDERQLIDEVLAAGDRHVRELMVPRTEVVFLDAAAEVGQAARLAAGTRHSRFPVIDANQDDVIGFVHLRDMLVRPDGATEITVAELARPLHRIPASKRLLAALSEMRRAGDQVALVVDEYGGTAGLVTLEDLIEELVGEIHDEYDDAPEAAVDGAPSEVDGLLNLSDFAERTGFTLHAGPYDTVGGYVMAALGRLPVAGDEVLVATPDGSWRLTVSEMDRRRVARVGLSRVAVEPVPIVPRPEAEDTTEPATTEPATTEPATTEPATTEPATEPAVALVTAR